MTGALADQIVADADALILDSPHGNNVTASQAVGTTHAYDFSAAIRETGNATDNVFPGSVSVSIVKSGDWVGSGGTAGPWTFNAYDSGQAGTILISVPSDACDVTRTMTVTLTAGASSNGKTLNPNSRVLSYVITGTGTCAPSDATPPEITYVLDPAPPNGSDGWYTSNVSLTWTVAENESPASLVTTGCVDQTVTSDQGSTSYSCAATSDGGSAGPVIVSVKRDATAPTIDASLSPPADAGTGWYNIATGYPTVTFTCGDATSGIPSGTCPGAHTFNSDAADQSFSANVSDAAGNPAGVGVSGVDVDLTAPEIAFLGASPAPDGAGWNNTDVVLTWSCTDATSGVVSATVQETIHTDGSDRTATGTCYDHAGNSSSLESGDVDRDTVDPTITADLSPAAAGTGWYNIATGAPTVSFSCSDDRSGIPTGTCPTTHTFGDGADQSFSADVSDAAGNSAGAGVSDVDVDLTPPTITFSGASPAPNEAGWNNSDVTLTWTCTDAISGAVQATVTQTISTEGSDQTATGICSDNAGNSSSLESGDVDLDKTAPTITFSGASPAPNEAGWNNSDVTLTWTCTDAISGAVQATVTQTISTEGSDQTATGICSDNAGNSSSLESGDVDLDKTAPTITAGMSPPAPAASGWYNIATGAPTVSFSCGDDRSGIPTGTCPAPHTFGNGENQSFSASVLDAAGNSSVSAGASDVDVDLTAPTLTWDGGPAGGGTYVFGSVPDAPTCEAHDWVSGPKDCGVSGYSTAVGAHTMTATAHDYADNAHTETRSYTVLAWTLRGFYQPVDMNGVYNVVKGGSTVPLKFEVFAGLSELTDTGDVKSLSAMRTPCPSAAAFDEIEVLSPTGGTTLRYDQIGGQFIYNWQTPKPAGMCYRVTMTTQDDSTLVAFFKTK